VNEFFELPPITLSFLKILSLLVLFWPETFFSIRTEIQVQKELSETKATFLHWQQPGGSKGGRL
jgi:hypothetical protein